MLKINQDAFTKTLQSVFNSLQINGSNNFDNIYVKNSSYGSSTD